MKNISRKKIKAQKGATIVGLLVAVIVLGSTFTAGIAFLSRQTRMTTITQNEITASYLAEEGIELVKNIRDSGDNFCLKNSQPLNGFTRVSGMANNGATAYAVDNRIVTYRNAAPQYPAGGQPAFQNSTAGLCQSATDPRLYQTCNIGDADRKFIRKIQILNANYNGDGGTITYTCSDPPGVAAPGVQIVSTVYWMEKWEGTWPAGTGDQVINCENTGHAHSKEMHKVRVSSCIYNWRPE